MLDRFFRLVSYDLGVDMGTTNTRIMVLGKGVAVREPTVVARHKKSKEIVAVGSEAKKMIGRTPGQLEAIPPLQDGVISDFDATLGMLSYYFKKLHQSHGLNIKIPKPKVAISIPAGVTDVEKKAVQDAAFAAGARVAYLVEEPMATAIGADLPIFEAAGALIVNIGGGTTELAVISLGGIVINKSLRVAGDEMDEAIINFLRLKYSILIGLPTAENLKIGLGSAWEIKGRDERLMVVRGRDLATGLPRSLRVNVAEVREALAPILNQLVGAISDIIEETPPELLGDIAQKGIYLAGGITSLPGLDLLVTETTKMPCMVVEDPLTVTVKGCAKVLADENLLQKVRVRGGVK
ncbi:MAG TPA: rod shape-determining protein [Patescibacteria group bacterium]|nr:rod shape-determining protein [Patescibacteria group bacterium]